MISHKVVLQSVPKAIKHFNNRLFISSQNFSIVIYEIRGNKIFKKDASQQWNHEGPIKAMSIKSGMLASCSEDGYIKYWNLNCKLLKEINFSRPLRSIEFMSDSGDMLVAIDNIILMIPIKSLKLDSSEYYRETISSLDDANVDHSESPINEGSIEQESPDNASDEESVIRRVLTKKSQQRSSKKLLSKSMIKSSDSQSNSPNKSILSKKSPVYKIKRKQKQAINNMDQELAWLKPKPVESPSVNENSKGYKKP